MQSSGETGVKSAELLPVGHAAMGESSIPTASSEPTPLSEPKSASSVLLGRPETPDPGLPLPPPAPVNSRESITVGVPYSNEKPRSSRSQIYPRLVLPRPLFALLIGIDKYQHYPPLVGAVKDVEDVFDFLLSSLSVPTSCITKLLDHEATADAIVNGIRSLAHHPDIKHGDAILVYFSGHGARAIAPQGWETSDGYVETICPVDISSDLTAKPLVSGIPDLMLNMLITQIAEKKGDNITVIFDCCHSANGLRGEQVVPGIRGIDKPPPISKKWEDFLPMRSFNRGTNTVSLQSLEFSVLLAACGRYERAGEGPQGGFFTQCLLDYIGGLSNEELSGLTYTDLIRSLSISNSQNPQCEGSKSDRFLFRTGITDRSFIYGWKSPQEEFWLSVGKPLGIKPDMRFYIYDKNTFSPDNQCCGRLIVRKVSETRSTLSFVDGQPEFVVPDQFYAVQTSFSDDDKLKVYCSDKKTLNQILLGHQDDFNDFVSLVEAPKDANLLVSFGDYGYIQSQQYNEFGVDIHRKIYLDWADGNIITQRSGSRINLPLSTDNPKKFIQTLRAATRFHYYLYCGEDRHQNQGIEMALRLLSTNEVVIDGTPIRYRVPVGENILKDESASIQLEKGKGIGPFGLTISNYTDKNLFPQVFWFEAKNLTITPWYTGQHSAGSPEANVRIDAPLRACQDNNGSPQPGEFSVGYGEVPVSPWGFIYGGSPSTILGFFKVFLTTFNADYTSLAQELPFDFRDGRVGAFWTDVSVEWWTTRRATIVQLPP